MVWYGTFDCALNALRVLLIWITFALDTRCHSIGIASMEAQHQQGESKLEELHVGCGCPEVTDRGALIFLLLMTILSQKVNPRLTGLLCKDLLSLSTALNCQSLSLMKWANSKYRTMLEPMAQLVFRSDLHSTESTFRMSNNL